MGPWEHPDPPESLAGGVAQEPTEPEACQDRPDQRETEASTAWPGFPVKRGTGASRDPPDPPALQERMERGEMMERSDPGDFLVNQAHVGCWDQKDPRDLPDHLA